MGIVVSFQPDKESPLNDLPWIVTFQPRDDESDWDSIVCGPYRREHAEALAEAVAFDLDDDLAAVAEPMLTALDAETVPAAIQRNREIATAVDDHSDEQGSDGAEDKESDDEEAENLELPEPVEIIEGVERVMRQLLSALRETEGSTRE